MTKSAELSSSYVEGFIKQAETLGFDGESLLKKAQQNIAPDFPERNGTHGIGNNALESAGTYTTLGGMSAIGAGLGSQRANGFLKRFGMQGIRGKGIGALAGLSAGFLANAVGRTKALASAGRTGQDQIDYDRRFKWGNLFVPGSGAYNNAKRNERVLLSQWHG